MTFPPAPPATAHVTVIIDWIASLGWNVTQETGYPLLPGPEIISSPDRAVFITPTTGPGYITEEGAGDTSGFQALVRGPFDDPVTPGLTAYQLDQLILFAPKPVTVDGVIILTVTRSGGGPTPLPLDPSDRRFSYTTTYLITTGGE